MGRARQARWGEGEPGTGGLAYDDQDPDQRFAGLDQAELEPEESEEEGPWSFLSTHPVTAERIARARAAP